MTPIALVAGGCGMADEQDATLPVATVVASVPGSPVVDPSRAAVRYRAIYAAGLITDERAAASEGEVEALFQQAFPDERPCDDPSITLTATALDDGIEPNHVLDYVGLVVAFCPLIDPDRLADLVGAAAPNGAPADLSSIVGDMVDVVADL